MLNMSALQDSAGTSLIMHSSVILRGLAAIPLRMTANPRVLLFRFPGVKLALKLVNKFLASRIL
jgi:hypothetical protein